MSADFSQFKLQTQTDYRVFAFLIAQKMRNPNFQQEWKTTFLQTLLEQLEPICSAKCYESIDKSLTEIGRAKYADETAEKKAIKESSNRKNKALKNLAKGRQNKFGYEEDEDFDDDDYDSEEEYD